MRRILLAASLLAASLLAAILAAPVAAAPAAPFDVVLLEHAEGSTLRWHQASSAPFVCIQDAATRESLACQASDRGKHEKVLKGHRGAVVISEQLAEGGAADFGPYQPQQAPAVAPVAWLPLLAR